MTGGGAGSLAWVHEPSQDYRGSPTDSDYKAFGIDQEVADLTIENAIQQLRNFSVEAKDAIETTFEGAFEVTGTMTLDTCWFLNHVFGSEPTQSGSGPYTYKWAIETQHVQSSRVYVGLQALDGFAERELKGVVCPQFEVDNSTGETTTFTATCFYGDEELATQATPGSEPTTSSDPFVFHGGSFDVDGATLKKMNSATLTIATGAHPLRGWERKPTDATFGEADHSLSASKIVTTTDLLTDAYGNSTAPTTSPNSVDSAPAQLVLGNGSDTLTLDMPRVTPDSHSWNDIGNADEDKTDSIDPAVQEVTAELETEATEAA